MRYWPSKSPFRLKLHTLLCQVIEARVIFSFVIKMIGSKSWCVISNFLHQNYLFMLEWKCYCDMIMGFHDYAISHVSFSLIQAVTCLSVFASNKQIIFSKALWWLALLVKNSCLPVECQIFHFSLLDLANLVVQSINVCCKQLYHHPIK